MRTSFRQRFACFGLLVGATFSAIGCSQTGELAADATPIDILSSVVTAPSSGSANAAERQPAASDSQVLGEIVSAPASPEAAIIEEQFLAMTNNTRVGVAAEPLMRDANLDAYARAHAAAMAGAGAISHSDIAGLLGPFWLVGENVGVGPEPTAIQLAYEASPSHYQNIVEPAYASVGIGVVHDIFGRIFTAQVYGA